MRHCSEDRNSSPNDLDSSPDSSDSYLLDLTVRNPCTDIKGTWYLLQSSLANVLTQGANYQEAGITIIPPTMNFLSKHKQFWSEDLAVLTKNVRTLMCFRSHTLWIRALAWSSISQADITTWLKLIDPSYQINRERFLTNQTRNDKYITLSYNINIDIKRYKIPEKFITNFNKFIKDPTRDLLVTPTNWRDYLEPSIFIIKEPHTRKSSCCSIL